MPTKTLATFNNGLVEFQVDYDASRRLTALRCINNGDTDVYAEAVMVSNGRKAAATFLAHTNTYIAIPTAASNRIQFSGSGPRETLIGIDTMFRG